MSRHMTRLMLVWTDDEPLPSQGSTGQVRSRNVGIAGTFLVTGCWEIDTWRADSFMLSVEVTLTDGTRHRGKGLRQDLLSKYRVYHAAPARSAPKASPVDLAASSEGRI